jgi:ribose 5-phosphate isomerase B
MKIVLGSDHRGYRCKEELLSHLRTLGHEIQDCGCHSEDSCDYPVFASAAAGAVSEGRADRAILICGSGIGMCIAANKLAGVRAALCHDEVTAEICRRHNNANVLCLSGDLANPRTIGRLAEVWLKTEFEGGRHQRRLSQVESLERRTCPDNGSEAEPAPSA